MKVLMILLSIFFFFSSNVSHGQDVKSNVVRFKINNATDTSPPSFKLMSPAISRGQTFTTDAEEFVLIGEVKDESGIKFISVNDDVRSINDAGIFTARIKLTPGENRIQVIASDNKDNIEQQFISIQYNPLVVTLADRISKEAKYYGLIIGIDKYQDPSLPNLQNPINDAEKLYNALISNYTFLPENIEKLTNATRAQIVYALDELANRVTPNDNVLIFFAGHGIWDERSNVGYWLPSDAYLTTTANWFRNSALVDYLKMINSKHTLLITDACFAGSIFQTRSATLREDRAYEVLYDLSSRKAMTSGTLTEVPDRSAFTRYLIDRLNENQDTYLSSWQLFSSFRIAVINNSDALPQYGEIKNVGDEGGEFIFIKK